MKVTDILRVKGNTLYTVHPDQPLAEAVQTMAELDIGSLVVMEHGDLVGMLTFREVIQHRGQRRQRRQPRQVRSVMDDAPLTCTPETEIDEVRRMMLHAPCALHAGAGPAHADGRDLVLRRGQDGGRRAGLREPHAQGLHPRLAGRGPAGAKEQAAPAGA
jgi:CBS domain-containing protein